MLSVLMVAQGNTETQQETVSEHLESREADNRVEAREASREASHHSRVRNLP